MPPMKLPRATLEQKIQILDFYHSSGRPQSETVDRYKNDISISTSSFSEWLKNEDELRDRLNQAGTAFSKNSRRRVKFKYEKINHAMDLLVQQRLERNEPINEPILREHWSIYAHQFGVDDPKRLVGFSHGWLSQFKKRHGLNKTRMSGNASSTTTASLSHGSSPSSNSASPSVVPVSTTNASYPNPDRSDVSNFHPDFTSNGGPGDVGILNNSLSKYKSSQNSGTVELTNPDNFANGGPERTSENTPASSVSNIANSANTSNTSTAASAYDLMNPQPSSTNGSAVAPNTSGNQFRPQQGLSFSATTPNLNLSNFASYQQSQPQQQHNQPSNQNQNQNQSQNHRHSHHKSKHSHEQSPSYSGNKRTHQQSESNDNSYDYQQQLRAHYEKQKHQYEQQQRLTRSSTRSTSGHGPNGALRAPIASTSSNPSNSTIAPGIIPPSQSTTPQQQQQQQQRHHESSIDVAAVPAPSGPSPGTSSGVPGLLQEGDQAATSGINDTDIERFIYIFADRFFHDRQYEYPQTVKIFQEFKNSFFNERIINIRSIKQQQQMIQHAANDSISQLQVRQQAQQISAHQQQQQQQQQISGIDDFFLRAADSAPSTSNPIQSSASIATNNPNTAPPTASNVAINASNNTPNNTSTNPINGASSTYIAANTGIHGHHGNQHFHNNNSHNLHHRNNGSSSNTGVLDPMMASAPLGCSSRNSAAVLTGGVPPNLGNGGKRYKMDR